MLIVDTTVWLDYFHGTESAHTFELERRMTQTRIGLTDLILIEILQGARDDRDFRRVEEQLTSFEVFSIAGLELAIACAQNYRFLRSRGVTPRGTIDCLTATFCIQNGYSLLHRDRDFDGFEKHLGLRVIHPVRH